MPFNVLIVDDDNRVFSVMKKTIEWEKFGMSVIGCATNGLKAIDFIKENAVDVVFTDIMMPHLGGLELIQHIHEFMPDIVFVVLSSYSEYSLVKDSFNFGAFDYILKVDIDDKEMTTVLLKKVKMQVESLKTSTKQRFNKHKLISKMRKDDEFIRTSKYRMMAISLEATTKAVIVSELLFFLNKNNDNFVYCFFDWKIVILIYGNNKNDIDRSIKVILEKIKSIEQNVVSIGISTHDEEMHIESLYDECNSAVEGKFYSSNEKFFDYVASKNSEFLDEVERCKIDIADLTIKYKFDDVRTKIDGFFYLARRERIKKNTLFNAVIECIEVIQDNISPLVIEIQGTQLIEIKQLVYSCTEFVKLKSIVMNVIDEYVSVVYAQTGNGVYYQITRYIEDNYGNTTLSLTDVANALGINKREISHHLVVNSGLLFKPFLNSVRINNAKNMLKNTSLRINEIAYRVGYTSVEHFSRVFTKEVMVPPSQYHIENRLER